MYDLDLVFLENFDWPDGCRLSSGAYLDTACLPAFKFESGFFGMSEEPPR